MERRMNCANGQTKTRRVDVFHQNVLRAVAVDSRPIHRLDREAVVLVPHRAVMNPNICSRHIETVRVEGAQILHTVIVVLVDTI